MKINFADFYTENDGNGIRIQVKDTKRTIKTIIVFANGMIAACDSNGEQIAAAQGSLVEILEDRIKEDYERTYFIKNNTDKTIKVYASSSGTISMNKFTAEEVRKLANQYPPGCSFPGCAIVEDKTREMLEAFANCLDKIKELDEEYDVEAYPRLITELCKVAGLKG